MEPLKFFVCGKCGGYHFIRWTGDCEDPHRRFDEAELNKAYGREGWRVVEQPVKQ